MWTSDKFYFRSGLVLLVLLYSLPLIAHLNGLDIEKTPWWITFPIMFMTIRSYVKMKENQKQ